MYAVIFDQVGDVVNLTLEPAHLLRATLLVYGLPLLGMLLALTFGWLLSGALGDAAAVLLAIGGLGAGFYIGRARLRRQECLQQFVPVIEGRASDVTAAD